MGETFNRITATKVDNGRQTYLSLVIFEGTKVTRGLGSIIETNGVFFPSNLIETVTALKDGGTSVTPLAQAALDLARQPVYSELTFNQKLPPINL